MGAITAETTSGPRPLTQAAHGERSMRSLVFLILLWLCLAFGLLVLAVLLLYALHQDVWLFRSARPLVLGFVPVGLVYHAGYCAAVSLLMWLLVRFAWPSHLEDGSDGDGASR